MCFTLIATKGSSARQGLRESTRLISLHPVVSDPKMGFPSTHTGSPGEPLPGSSAAFTLGMLEIYMEKMSVKFLRFTLVGASDEMAILVLGFILRSSADHPVMGCRRP